MNDKINLYIMDISYAYGMNGVDRSPARRRGGPAAAPCAPGGRR